MPEQIENRMVVDSEWPVENCIENVLKEKGWHNFQTNEFVPEKEAYEYALDEALHGDAATQKEFREMLVEWFFSGNWVKED